MSETLANTEVHIEPASHEDVERTLKELRRTADRVPDLESQLKAERARRLSLENNLDGERVARTTAEIQRDEATNRVISEAEQRWNAEKSAAEAAIAAKEQALEQAVEEFTRHSELGDWKEAGKAQRAIAEHTAQKLAAEHRVQYLETNKERIVPKAPPTRTATERPPGRPSHKYGDIITNELVGGEEAWIDARPRILTDQAYRQTVFDASNLASRRYERGSDQYLREIERIIGEDDRDDRRDNRRTRDRDYDDRDEDYHPGRDYDRDEPRGRGRERDEPRGRERDRDVRADPPRRERAYQESSDLPPARRAGPGQQPSGNTQEVRLTPEEAEIADGMYGDPNSGPDWYVPNQKERYLRYAANKAKMASRM
jgi:hypothetical protein